MAVHFLDMRVYAANANQCLLPPSKHQSQSQSLDSIRRLFLAPQLHLVALSIVLWQHYRPITLRVAVFVVRVSSRENEDDHHDESTRAKAFGKLEAIGPRRIKVVVVPAGSMGQALSESDESQCATV